MRFQLTEEQLALQTMAANFAQAKLAPFTAEWDTQAFFPTATLKEAAQLGMASLFVQQDIGGTGLSRLNSALVFAELARGCISTTAYLTVHNMVAGIIDKYGTAAQRSRWLPQLITMEQLASYCLTEPDAGSDAASLKTTAIREGDYYILNGSKAFISGGGASDIYVCMVRTGDNTANGISCIVVEKNTPGLSFGNPENKLGWRNQPTTMVFFENCRVPVSHLLGQENTGFKIALNALNGGRINIAACSLGGAQACLAFAKQYMNERQQFGKKLADLQALQFKIADMATDLEAARLLVWRAADALDHHDPEAPLYCAMAKRFATDAGFRIANEALQILGGYGYLKDYPIEQHFRDLRVHQILEGTNEIMRVIIAKRILNESFSNY